MKAAFLKKLAKYTPGEAEDKALDSLTKMKLLVDKEERKLQAALSFSRFVPDGVLAEMESGIKAAYALNEVSVSPRFEGVTFGKEHCADLISVFSRFDNGGVARSFLEGADFAVEDGVLTISLRSGLDPCYLYRVKADRFLENCIETRFESGLRVHFAGGGDSGFQSAEAEEFEAKSSDIFYRLLEERAEEEKKTKKEEEERKKKTAGETQKEKDAAASAKESSALADTADRQVHSAGAADVYICGGITFDLREKAVLYGRASRGGVPMPIAAMKKDEKNFFCGRLFLVEANDSRDGTKTHFKLYLTDLQSSVIVRVSDDSCGKLQTLSAGCCLFVEGRYVYDKRDEEYEVRASCICKIKDVPRVDCHPTPRVELHLHTNMSASDALPDAGEVVKLAESWHMPAVAVTDHGNAQSFPELMKATTKKRGGASPVKPIYGMEGYLVDDTARAVFNYDETTHNLSLSDDEFVVFDLETTGLVASSCGITQIGAVVYRDGETAAEFETFVNPGMPIPAEVSALTGIKDEDVKDAPSEKDAVEAFLKFAAGRMLVAHNASFDTGFIRRVAQHNGLRFDNAYLDTVSLSRYLNPELKRHRLEVVAAHYRLGDFEHHRATDDAKMLAAVFGCMAEQLKKQGVYTVNDMLKAMGASADPKRIPEVFHVSILVKNAAGLKNLYKIISRSYLDFFFRVPRIPKTLLSQYREGLIIGSACEKGELYQALLEDKSYADIMKTADFYDYLEIMPICNNAFLVGDGRVKSEDALRKINRRIVKIAEEQKKPCVATGDVHFLEKEDEIYRKVLLNVKKMKNSERSTGLYLRTTDEMLAEFAYLGKEKAFEVVVTNTRAIADTIEDVLPIPNGQYTPDIPGAAEKLKELCYAEAKNRFGDPLPRIVADRLEKELGSIIEHGFATLYMVAVKLVKHSEENGYLVGSRGSVGSSIVASLSGISEVDPLPPHYRCPKCKKSVFFTDGSVGSGFDLPDRNCDVCGTKMINDGHDIPFETFLGFKGDKAPDIDLNFSGEIQSKSHKYTETLFGSENIFRAGTVSVIKEKTAFGYAKKYAEDHNKTLSRAETARLAMGCIGVKRTTGQHPGGIVVIPKGHHIYDFTPVQYPADKEKSGVVTTHFAFDYLHDTLLKLDMLGHDVPTIYRKLTDYTGIDVRDVPMNDRAVMGLFLSPKPLGLTSSQIGSETGTYGMPECGTRYVRKMLKAAKPRCFSDLLQISGLSHGKGIWTGNGETLINEGVCTISEIIGTRDSIMLSLIKRGVNYQSAFKIMEDVRKGRGVKTEYEQEMREAGVPVWYIESCKKIEYMFPKAHAAAYMIAALRLGWFKVHRPLEFYAAYFTVKQNGFDANLMLDRERAEKVRLELEALPSPTDKEEDTLTMLYLVREMLCRRIYFLPVDVFKSEAFAFVPEDGKIRLPLSSLSGLGETAAANIYRAVHEGHASTFEDLKNKASLNKTVAEVLKASGAVKDLAESDQLTLF